VSSVAKQSEGGNFCGGVVGGITGLCSSINVIKKRKNLAELPQFEI